MRVRVGCSAPFIKHSQAITTGKHAFLVLGLRHLTNMPNCITYLALFKNVWVEVKTAL